MIMESMECDSDGDHNHKDHPQSVSPMQWDTCSKTKSYAHDISAFPLRQTLPVANRNQNHNSLYEPAPSSSQSGFKSPDSRSGFKSPDSSWSSCRNVFSAVTAFSGFRSSQGPMSPSDVNRSFEELSDGEEEPLTGREPSKYSVPELLDSSTGVNSVIIKESIPRNSVKYSRTFGGFSAEGSTGKTSRYQRHSLPVESPLQARPSRHSVDPVSMGYGRSRSVATSDSGNTHADSSSSFKLRSLSKTSKRKMETVYCEKKVDSPKSKERNIVTFKSFLLFNVLIGACLSVYAFKMFHPGCGDIGDFDPQKLSEELHLNVYGQHLAVDTIPHLLDEYFSKVKSGQDSKSLVISLHGWTGVGKNFVSMIVSNFIPFSSITKFVVPLNFPHEAQNDGYAEQIPEWTATNITQGCVNFVVFDEMDKAGDGVIRGFNESINVLISRNLTATPVVFLLLSNSKGAEINRFVFQKVSSSRSRESLSYDDLVQVFENGAGLWYRKLESVIDSFIPFLPLEKKHVVQCIKKDMTSKGLNVNKETVNEVLKEMSFFKSSSGKEFSHTGCKRVSDKVNLVRNFQE